MNAYCMRVLHLFDTYLPSTLSWVSRLLTHLADEAQVEIAAPWIVRNQFYQPELKHHVFPLQRYFFSKAATEWDFPRWQKLYTRSQRFFPSYPFWLGGLLASSPPDILHAHFGPTGCLYLPLAKRLKRPLVVTFYGFDYRKLLHHRPSFEQKYRALFAGAARVIAASETGCAALEKMGCPASKLAVVRPSPELAHFPFHERRKPAGRLNLVQVATFTEKKGHLTTLEAFRSALSVCPGLRLTLAGERYDRRVVDGVERYIREHRLEPFVRWLGPIQHSGMAGFLEGFDAFIHPSCTAPDGDHEATPVVLLEAQATGLPVLATRHFDLPDEIIHGKTGWLVGERDAGALAAAIHRFCEMDSDSFREYSGQARAHVEQSFTIERSAERLLNIYRVLV